MDRNEEDDFRDSVQVRILMPGRKTLFTERLNVVAVDKQFVLQGLCLALGDSGVGKTSLVRAGKAFDPRQTKTLGIDQCLVDRKWKNHNVRDRTPVDLWKFFTEGVLQVLYVFPAGADTSFFCVDQFVVWRRGSQLTFGVLLLLWLLFTWVGFDAVIGFVLSLHQIITATEITNFSYFCVNSDLRLTFCTLHFILRRRGFIIGSFLALLICYFNPGYLEFASTRSFFLMSIVTGIVFVAFFLSFGPITMQKILVSGVGIRALSLKLDELW